ncbi:MAG: hypothetical protein AB3N11_17995 [Arenibacterium sp.]
MFKAFGIPTALTLLCLSQPAQADYARATDIIPFSNDVFDVSSNVGAESSIFWCGAGTHLRGKVPNSQRVYVVKGPRFRTVRFSLTPPEDATVPLSTSVAIVGNSLSVVQAAEHCTNKNIKD